MDRCSCWVVLTGGVWRIQKPLKSLFFRSHPVFLAGGKAGSVLPVVHWSLAVCASCKSGDGVCQAFCRERSARKKSRFWCSFDDLMTVENFWILCACCLTACRLVSRFFLGVTKRPFCVLNGKIIRCLISRYGIDLGDSVSFRLCSDLFTVKSDFQASIRSYIYLYDKFWTCIVRT